MTIDGAQPVLAAMTCVVSRFAVPGLVSLGEAMLIDDQGAIAVWGPSGPSIHAQASLLGRELMNELSSGTETRLGPMINRTFPVVANLEFGRDTIEIYHLLGDPALRVAKADESPGPAARAGLQERVEQAAAPATAAPACPVDGLTTAGCSVGSSGHDAPVLWFMLIGALTLLLRKRNAKRRGRR